MKLKRKRITVFPLNIASVTMKMQHPNPFHIFNTLEIVLADLGGEGVILSFRHTKFSKLNRLGSQ